MRSKVIEILCEEAEKNPNIVLLVADLGYSVVEPFQTKFPDRFFNVGIAEQNMIGIAAGLAISGNKVFIYGIIPFVTMRCFEQLRVDISYMNLDVTIIGVGAGVSYGPAGTTHHALEDIGLIRCLPNFAIYTPANAIEIANIMEDCILSGDSPNYIRIGRIPSENTISITDINDSLKSIHKGTSDLSIICCNDTVNYFMRKFLPEFIQQGINPSVYNIWRVNPFQSMILQSVMKNGNTIVLLEDQFHNIGIFPNILEVANNIGYSKRIYSIDFAEEYFHEIGSEEFLLQSRLGKTITEIISTI